MTTSATLDELRTQLALKVDERVAAGDCGCGCGSDLPLNPGRRKYLNERHRQKAYRDRLEAEANALGVPSRLSLRTLQSPSTTRDRHADAPARRQRPQRRRSRPRLGVTVYLATPGLARRLLADLRNPPAPGANLSSADTGTLTDTLEAALRRAADREHHRIQHAPVS